MCQANVACDAPFSAGFTVTPLTTSSLVAHFRSDANGQFTVYIEPGSYRIVPDADAPIISPSSQSKTVTVAPSGLTEVALEFDTGIR